MNTIKIDGKVRIHKKVKKINVRSKNGVGMLNGLQRTFIYYECTPEIDKIVNQYYHNSEDLYLDAQNYRGPIIPFRKGVFQSNGEPDYLEE